MADQAPIDLVNTNPNQPFLPQGYTGAAGGQPGPRQGQAGPRQGQAPTQQINPFQQALLQLLGGQQNQQNMGDVMKQMRTTRSDDQAAAQQAKTDKFFAFKNTNPANRASQGNTAENQWAKLGGGDILTQSQQEAGATGMDQDEIDKMKKLQGQAAVMQRDQKVPLQSHGVVEEGPNGQNKIYSQDGDQVGSSYQADPNLIGPPVEGKINGMPASQAFIPQQTIQSAGEQNAAAVAQLSPQDQAEYARLVAEGTAKSGPQKKPGKGGLFGTGMFAPRP